MRRIFLVVVLVALAALAALDLAYERIDDDYQKAAPLMVWGDVVDPDAPPQILVPPSLKEVQ